MKSPSIIHGEPSGLSGSTLQSPTQASQRDNAVGGPTPTEKERYRSVILSDPILAQSFLEYSQAQDLILPNLTSFGLQPVAVRRLGGPAGTYYANSNWSWNDVVAAVQAADFSVTIKAIAP